MHADSSLSLVRSARNCAPGVQRGRCTVWIAPTLPTVRPVSRGGDVVLWGKDMMAGPPAYKAPPPLATLPAGAPAALAFRASLGRELLAAARAAQAPGSAQAAALASGPPVLDALRRGTHTVLRYFQDRGAHLACLRFAAAHACVR
jgi:hypothetical protein